MNEIIQKMKTRHAIRRFQNKPIEEELLDQIYRQDYMHQVPAIINILVLLSVKIKK